LPLDRRQFVSGRRPPARPTIGLAHAPGPAKKGDHLEFFAGGDLSVPLWGPEAQDPISVCRPLGVEVCALDPRLLEGWKPPESPLYKGAHGLRLRT